MVLSLGYGRRTADAAARPAVLCIEPACSGLAPSGLVLAFPCCLRSTARSARPRRAPGAGGARSFWRPPAASARTVSSPARFLGSSLRVMICAGWWPSRVFRQRWNLAQTQPVAGSLRFPFHRLRPGIPRAHGERTQLGRYTPPQGASYDPAAHPGQQQPQPQRRVGS